MTFENMQQGTRWSVGSNFGNGVIETPGSNLLKLACQYSTKFDILTLQKKSGTKCPTIMRMMGNQCIQSKTSFPSSEKQTKCVKT